MPCRPSSLLCRPPHTRVGLYPLHAQARAGARRHARARAGTHGHARTSLRNVFLTKRHAFVGTSISEPTSTTSTTSEPTSTAMADALQPKRLRAIPEAAAPAEAAAPSAAPAEAAAPAAAPAEAAAHAAHAALLGAIFSSDVVAVESLLKAGAPGCEALLNPPLWTDPSALDVAINVVLSAEKCKVEASDALAIVELLVRAGANPFGSLEVSGAAGHVFAGFVPATPDKAAYFTDLDFDYYMNALRAVAGSMDLGGLLTPGLRALLEGSLRLVTIVCTDVFVKLTTVVAYFLKEECDGDVQWGGLLSFVVWRRSDADAHKLGILEFLVSRGIEDDMDPLLLECEEPGSSTGEYPLVHGLLARNIQQGPATGPASGPASGPAPGPASDPAFAAVIKRLLKRWPRLALTYNCDNMTPYVKAAQDGDLEAMKLLESAMGGLDMAPERALGVELADDTGGAAPSAGLAVDLLTNPTRNNNGSFVQESCDVRLTERGVWRLDLGTTGFNAVQAFMAAAVGGQWHVIFHLMQRFVLHLTTAAASGGSPDAAHVRIEEELTHDGFTMPGLLLRFVANLPSGPTRTQACRHLQEVLGWCRYLGPVCFVDAFGNSALHLAVYLQALDVVRVVLTVFGQDWAMVTAGNDRGFTALALALHDKEAFQTKLSIENARAVKDVRLLSAARLAYQNAEAVCAAVQQAVSH